MAGLPNDPRLLAQLDQVLAQAKDHARLSAGYFHALVQEGVPTEHAAPMAGQYIAILLALAAGGDDA